MQQQNAAKIQQAQFRRSSTSLSRSGTNTHLDVADDGADGVMESGAYDEAVGVGVGVDVEDGVADDDGVEDRGLLEF